MSIPLRILISGDSAFLQQLLGENMSGKWCHWYKLSPAEWENCDHEKGDMWSIQLIKDNLEEQRINLDIIPSEKNDVYYLYFLFNRNKKLYFFIVTC